VNSHCNASLNRTRSLIHSLGNLTASLSLNCCICTRNRMFSKVAGVAVYWTGIIIISLLQSLTSRVPISPNSTRHVTSRHDALWLCRACRTSRLDTTNSTGSTRRTCRVVSRCDVTSQVEFGLYGACVILGTRSLSVVGRRFGTHLPDSLRDPGSGRFAKRYQCSLGAPP